MRVIVAKDYKEMSSLAADEIEAVVRAEPRCTLGLATGSSPVGMYQELARRCREEGLDFSGIHSVNLDEYVGLTPDHDQSYRYFMDTNLFDHINIDKANTYVAKGVGDADENLREFNAVLDKADIAVQVLGVGPDGHLGFNEPGDTLYDGAHKETLDESTIDANARFFASRDDVPRYAVTMGMGEIMMAKRLLMILSGASKADAARQLLMSDAITTACPATLMKLHQDATVIITEELADMIGYKY
jgi:glucosamine-6-phosphate deaminase